MVKQITVDDSGALLILTDDDQVFEIYSGHIKRLFSPEMFKKELERFKE